MYDVQGIETPFELPCNARSNFSRLVSPSYTAVLSYTALVEEVGTTSSSYGWRHEGSDGRTAPTSHKMHCNALDICSAALQNALLPQLKQATRSHFPSREISVENYSIVFSFFSEHPSSSSSA
jgi:hypothetical protein